MSHDKLKQILSRELKLRNPRFRLEGRGRVSGSVISTTFAGKGDSDRQRMIWDALDKELGASSVREVGMLLAYTPDEWDLALEGNTRGKPPAQKKAG
jgi:acid stress-induced BolA-like protein IbaG/YrbA